MTNGFDGIGAHTLYPHSRMPRDQREAGIEHNEWADRLKPLRPWAHDLAALAGLAVMVTGIYYLLLFVAGK